jgi:DedD protein
VNIKQLYGSTETAVFVCLQPDNEARADTVGVPCKGVEIKVAEVTKVESKLADKKEVKNEQPKLDERFTVQVGVYSDAANVKRLQEQLKQAGYMTSTEKVTTAKGESIRLKVGDFKTRQEAIGVLDKLKAIGFSGIVIATS